MNARWLWAASCCLSVACTTQALNPAEDAESGETTTNGSVSGPDSATGSTTHNPAPVPAETTSIDADTRIDTASTTPESHDAGMDGVRCDTRKLTCKRAAPACDFGYVPRIIDGCYGDCVAVETCICSGPEECPDNGQYTCNNSRDRCTPYLR